MHGGEELVYRFQRVSPWSLAYDPGVYYGSSCPSHGWGNWERISPDYRHPEGLRLRAAKPITPTPPAKRSTDAVFDPRIARAEGVIWAAQ